jgi:hypothetical protein
MNIVTTPQPQATARLKEADISDIVVLEKRAG